MPITADLRVISEFGIAERTIVRYRLTERRLAELFVCLGAKVNGYRNSEGLGPSMIFLDS